ncbi:MAG TPA: LOG family protein [bacterium]|nr:LOG family protein [bacterium]
MSNGCVTVFGSSRVRPGEPAYADAVRLGRLLAEAGFSLCTGGYAGVMEAVSRGAVEAGGHAIGVTVSTWAARHAPNRWVREELAMPDLFQRIARLTATDAYVALPGGMGTLGEVALTWNLFQTESIPRRPLVLVGRPWRDALECLRGAIRIEAGDIELVKLVDRVDDVVPAIRSALPGVP